MSGRGPPYSSVLNPANRFASPSSPLNDRDRDNNEYMQQIPHSQSHPAGYQHHQQQQSSQSSSAFASRSYSLPGRGIQNASTTSRDTDDPNASTEFGSTWLAHQQAVAGSSESYGPPAPHQHVPRSSSYASVDSSSPSAQGFAVPTPPFAQQNSRNASRASLHEASRAIQQGHSGGDYSRYSAIPRPQSGIIMHTNSSGSSAEGPSGYATGTDSVEHLYSYPDNGSTSGLVMGAAGFAGHQHGNRASMASSLYSEGGRGFGGRYSAMPGAGGFAPLPKSDDSALLWDPKNAEQDDYLHNPEPGGEKPQELNLGSSRGWINAGLLFLVVAGLLAVFLAYPIVVRYDKDPWSEQHPGNLGRGYSQLIDDDTPQAARTWKSLETGEDWELVFSDEFNKDGRTFYPGDDPFWEATSLNYYGTHNFEFTDPEAVTTHDGKMVITLSEKNISNYLGTFDFQSGMIQSWNKLCFKDAYIEISASQPGNATSLGYWPGLWSQGNLARAGFGSTNDGLWPYSYSACDVGTLRNQTWPDGTPSAARTTGSRDYGGSLSYLPGQRLSACTCPGEEHPGPSPDIGRSGPEIDLLEGMYYGRGNRGMASQSLQIAPFDAGYAYDNSSTSVQIYQPQDMTVNLFAGSITQQALSYIKYLDQTSYNGTGYTSYGYEYRGGEDGYITWTVNSTATWTARGSAVGPDSRTQISQRLIPVEPMYAIMNLFISDKFQGEIDEYALTYPAFFFIDYVRIYQKTRNLECSPSDFPTSDYISKHIKAYTHPEYTNWTSAGFEWPKSSLRDGGC